MKLSRIALLIALYAGFSVEITHTEEKASEIHFSAHEQAFITDLFNAGITCTAQINQVIEQLAILVAKKDIKNLKNRDQVMRIFTQDRQLLNGFLQSLSSVKNPSDQIAVTFALLQLCDIFIDHLEKGLQSNLNNLKPFDPQKMQTQTRFANLTPDKLPDAFEEIQQRIQQLKEKANNAGLTWYNLAARSIDKQIVTPWNKYHGSTITKSVGGALLLSSYAIWKFGHLASQDSYISTIWEKINSVIGSAGEKNLHGYGWTKIGSSSSNYGSAAGMIDITNSSQYDLGKIGMIDAFLTDTLSNHLPLAMIGGGFLWNQYSDTWKTEIKPRLQQKVSLWWNKMRGGAYLKSETSGLVSLDPKVSFDDMTGLEEVKEEFKALLEYLDNPEQFTMTGKKPETGWILTGPTRTGKSFSFECLCGEIAKMQRRKGQNADFKFIKIGIEEIQKYTIQGLLSFARENGPMIIFVDEIDLLGLQRVGDNKLLHDFLTGLQTTLTEDPSKVVILMAATNCPETLDKALRQNGRFGKEIRFEYPSFANRKQYIIKELSNMALNTNDFDIDSLVAKTHEKSYEDMRAIIRSAMTHAWINNQPLTQKLLEDAVNREMHKIIMIDRKELPEAEKRILSAHFAGQALAMLSLSLHAQLDKVTTKAIMADLQETTAWYVMHAQNPKDEQKKIVHGGIFTQVLHDTIDYKTRENIINEAKVLLAGFAAEEIILGSCGMQCHREDNAKAYDILEQLVCEGIDPTRLSKATRAELCDKTYKLHKQCKTEITQLLTQHRDTLNAIADALMEHSILSNKDIKAIIDAVEHKTEKTTPATA